MQTFLSLRRAFGVFTLAFGVLAVGGAGALLGVCGPFTDVAADAFCPFVLEVFTLAITTGTTPTTYDPAGNVSRLQMAAFLSRSVDRVLQRGSRRAALRQFWTSKNGILGVTTLAASPQFLESDGTDLWITHSSFGGIVSRVRGGDGKLLETWTGASSAQGLTVAMGKIFIVGNTDPGTLYWIEPGQPAGAVTTVSTSLGKNPFSAAFDGSKIWTANNGAGSGGGVSIVTPGLTLPWSSANVTAGFTACSGILFDGTNIWVAELLASAMMKLDSGGAILQTVTVGSLPYFPVFDGSNIWVPNNLSNSVSVVRASNGTVLATLTANGLNSPSSASFDGQRILVVNATGTNTVSLWKAADLTPLGSFPTGSGTNPIWSASDGVNFWLTLNGTNQLARF